MSVERKNDFFKKAKYFINGRVIYISNKEPKENEKSLLQLNCYPDLTEKEVLQFSKGAK